MLLRRHAQQKCRKCIFDPSTFDPLSIIIFPVSYQHVIGNHKQLHNVSSHISISLSHSVHLLPQFTAVQTQYNLICCQNKNHSLFRTSLFVNKHLVVFSIWCKLKKQSYCFKYTIGPTFTATYSSVHIVCLYAKAIDLKCVQRATGPKPYADLHSTYCTLYPLHSLLAYNAIQT